MTSPPRHAPTLRALPRAKRRHVWLATAAALLFGSGSSTSFAITRIVLEVGEIRMPGGQVSGLTATLDLAARRPFARVVAKSIELPAPVGALRKVEVTCTDLMIREPRFGCRHGHVNARGGPTKTLSMNAAGEYNTARSSARAHGSDFAVAGGVAQFGATFDSRGWTLEASANALDIRQVRELVSPWLKVPEGLTFDGHVDARGNAATRGGPMHVNAELTTADLNFTNREGTVVAEKVATALRIDAVQSRTGFDIEAGLDGSAGQALAGPVLLDFGVNPLNLEARGTLAREALNFDDITLVQKNLAEARGQARVALGDSPSLASAHLELANVQFPAAYTSFMQIGLAASDFGQLKITGSARGSVDVANNAPTRLDLQLADLVMEDAKGKFAMADVNAELHWAADATASVMPSFISWNRASAYGLSGGAARLDFIARGLGFELTAPARLPVFDGAVRVNRLATRHLGAADAELEFDARIEPINMKLISRAFGWPELSGQLAGTIPGLTYRKRVLSVDGDLVASVFDGTIVGRGFRLQDPLGPWPRLFADVTARRLDLSLVTNTFSIGSITGRLDADVNHLELFNWSPVAFDARLYSTPGDKSKKLISQKAVTSISNVGGGGGSVTAALQSGVLKFFDQFRYDRIGIACKLENDVCLMSGIEPAGIGYYLVKGRGLPHIDIIGNQGRVAWPQLVAQIVTGMKSNVVVK